jgi:D-amino peptidase
LYRTPEWADACAAMTADADAVVRALFDAGATRVAVKDFHRTGYNLLRERLDPRAELWQGYRAGRSPGIGDAPEFDAAVFIGLHAASGGPGFIPHTLTSRIAEIRCNGKLLPEFPLFAASLAPDGIAPVFFSGGPEACRQAAEWIPDIRAFPVDQADPAFNPDEWRKNLAREAALSLSNSSSRVFRPEGPFECSLRMRDGDRAAEKLAKRWKFRREGDTLLFREDTMEALYMQLIRAVYLTPLAERFIGLVLPLFNLHGKLGLSWVRARLSRKIAEA